MPRKGPAPRRILIPDPVYHSELVTRFINRMLLSGKRSIAERIFYGAMEQVEEKAGASALEVFTVAMRNVKPVVEVKPRRVARAHPHLQGRFGGRGRARAAPGQRQLVPMLLAGVLIASLFCHRPADPLDLHSFPPRRSSDLPGTDAGTGCRNRWSGPACPMACPRRRPRRPA